MEYGVFELEVQHSKTPPRVERYDYNTDLQNKGSSSSMEESYTV